MLELIRGTWFPTLLFAVPILGFELWYGGSSPPVGTWTVIVLIVVPLTWWRAAARPIGLGRGAASGALCGALIVLLPATPIAIAVAVNPRQGEGGLVTFAWFMFVAVALVVLVPLGAAIGLLTALLQRLTVAKRPS